MTADAADLPPRDAMDFDVVDRRRRSRWLGCRDPVKQLAATAGKEISVVVLEKGSEVGAHILSGAVIDPKWPRMRCIPDWKEKGAPVDNGGHRGPLSLSRPVGRHALAEFPDAAADEQSRQLHRQPRQLVRWLGEQATELGVEIYPGSRRRKCFMTTMAPCVGVATGDMGVGRDGKPKDELRARHGTARQVHVHRRRRARLAGQAADREISRSTRAASRRSTASASRSSGRSRRPSTSPASCSTRSAGRSTIAPAAARSSITTATTKWPSASCVHLNYANPYLSTRSRSSSASRRIP